MARKRKQLAVAEKSRKKQNVDKELQQNWSILDGVDDLENIPRSFGATQDEEALPVIVNGKVQRQRKVPGKTQEINEESESNSDAEPQDEPTGDSVAEEEIKEPSESELKEQIAAMAELVAAEPEEHLIKLRDLLTIARNSTKARTRQLIFLSLLEIYKGLIPGYRIKPLTEAQQKEKASKEVRQLREFEQRLLSQYKAFVGMICSAIKQGKTPDAGKKHYAVGSTAIKVACELLESAPQFNFRLELIVALVDKLGSQRVDHGFSQILECFEILFDGDREGFISLETVQSLSRMIKSKRYKVDSRVLGILVHLRLLTELVGRADLERLVKDKPQGELAGRRKDRVHLTRRERKARKDALEVEEEMRKAETVVNAEMREKLQAQTLKLVLSLYLNILKVRSKNLMGAALEGLAKFAHLINVELFGDLLEVLREISESGPVSSRQVLLCVVTAFALLGAQATDAKGLDLSYFVNKLYMTLPRMSLDPQVEQSHKSLASTHRGKLSSETDMLVRSLEGIFMKRVNVSRARTLAFVKRLATCALCFPERTALISLNLIQNISKQHPYAKALATTRDRVANGQYRYDADVPEHANAEVACLWELSLLSQHYNPVVAKTALKLSRMRDS